MTTRAEQDKAERDSQMRWNFQRAMRRDVGVNRVLFWSHITSVGILCVYDWTIAALSQAAYCLCLVCFGVLYLGERHNQAEHYEWRDERRKRKMRS